MKNKKKMILWIAILLGLSIGFVVLILNFFEGKTSNKEDEQYVLMIKERLDFGFLPFDNTLEIIGEIIETNEQNKPVNDLFKKARMNIETIKNSNFQYQEQDFDEDKVKNGGFILEEYVDGLEKAIETNNPIYIAELDMIPIKEAFDDIFALTYPSEQEIKKYEETIKKLENGK